MGSSTGARAAKIVLLRVHARGSGFGGPRSTSGGACQADAIKLRLADLGGKDVRCHGGLRWGAGFAEDLLGFLGACPGGVAGVGAGDETLAVEVGGELLDRVVVGVALDGDVALNDVEARVHVFCVVFGQDFFVEHAVVDALLRVGGLLHTQREGDEELRAEEGDILRERVRRRQAGVAWGIVGEGEVVDCEVDRREEREKL